MYKFERSLSAVRNRIPNTRVRALLMWAMTGAIVAAGAEYTDNVNALREQHAGFSFGFNATPALCDEPSPQLSGEPLKKAAEACLADLEAPVVMVGFDMPDTTLKTMKDASESSIIDGFDGTVQPHIVAIQASPQAEHLLHETNPDCVDTKKLDSYASKVADETMDLKRYSHIIGLTTLNACQPAGGVTSMSNNGRYMDVYGVPSAKREMLNYNDILSKASDVAHEYGHGGLKLGHAGVAVGEAGYKGEIDRGPTIPPFEFYDIEKIITNEEYDEYGNKTDIMAKADTATGTILNNFQRRKITWPQRALESAPDPLQLVNGKTIELGMSQSEQYSFAALKLTEPVTGHFKNNDGDTQDMSFDYLVVDPRYPDEGSPLAARVYLANKESAETVAIALLFGNYKAGSRPLERGYDIGNQSLYVAVAYDKITVTDTSR